MVSHHLCLSNPIPDLAAVYIAIISSSLVGLNIFGVRIYGEGEFYFSLFKIFLILGLLVMTCECINDSTGVR